MEYAGGTYTGEVLNGVPHGKGALRYSDGEYKVNVWKNGKLWEGGHALVDGTIIRYWDGEVVSTSREDIHVWAKAYDHYMSGRYEAAYPLWLELAEKGDTTTYSFVATMLHEGQGIPQDFSAALKWTQKQLMEYPDNAGKGEAAWNINTHYAAGRGVPKDDAMAWAYVLVAKALGNETAIKHLEEGERIQRDTGKYPKPDYVVAQGQALARQIWTKIEAAKSGKSEGKSEATTKRSESTGSGFYINFEGHIITNSHVVNDCHQINTLQDGKKYNATVVINDSRNDLALLKSGNQPKTIANFRGGRGIRAGEDILAFGYPFQDVLSDELKGTKGMVNALSGLNNDSRIMQISAPVQPGNSGGPLLDQAGNVVGVVTAKMDAVKMAKYTGDIPQNVNFAIKASLVRDMLEVKDVDYDTASSNEELKTVDIFQKAKRFTVLIECLQ